MGLRGVPPWLFLALLISLLAALGYQILLVRSIRMVPVYWAVALAAFLLAEASADAVNLHSPHLGELQIIPDLAGVALALGALRLARV